MQFIIVTGMSGAGKSTVLKFLEDIGYFCVDNLPPSLIPKFAEICLRTGSDIEKVALGIDIRGGKLLDDLLPSLVNVSKPSEQDEYATFLAELNPKILFLDASNETLIKRYKETRRSHPLAKNERIEKGILKERDLLINIKANSAYIIDTTYLLTRQLKKKINDIFLENEKFNSMMITILSFGFKYGIPNDVDLVFDVRFLPNPFYDAEMKESTGLDIKVREFVMKHEVAMEFMDKLVSMVDFLIPNYINEGKNQLVIGIGCTGGKHRSVTFAVELHDYLSQNGHSVLLTHRDIHKY